MSKTLEPCNHKSQTFGKDKPLKCGSGDMMQMKPGNDSNKSRRRSPPQRLSVTSNLIPPSDGTKSRPTSKSHPPPWAHYHHKFPPPPPYYPGPPPIGFYHPYYYHYPPYPGYHFQPQWPPTSPPHSRRTSSKTKEIEASTAKTDIKSKTCKPDLLENTTSKRIRTNSVNSVTISDKKSTVNAASSTNCSDIDRSGGDVILAPASPVHPPVKSISTLGKNKRPLSPMSVCSSSFSSVDEKKERIKREIISSANEEERRDGPQTNSPDDSVIGSNISNKEDNVEFTQMEMEQLADVLGMDEKTDNFCDHSDDKSPETPRLDDVTDPLDLQLMSSARLVTFKHIGAGLENSALKEKVGQN